MTPGPMSLKGLEWLSRMGASPLEPWGLVMDWGRAVTYDHARRLAAAGLVRMVPMTRGDQIAFRDVLIVAVLTTCPIRMRNLEQIEIGRH